MLVSATPEAIAAAAAHLLAGGVVAFPTETVYGLGALAFDPIAVARVFEVKGRPVFDPLIVHVLDLPMLATVAQTPPALARRLIARFWPGPLSLVLRKHPAVPGIVTAGLPTVAVRMSDHPIARALLAAAAAPLAAPSANPFGAVSPTRAQHVEALLGARVEMILDGGRCERGLESTIIGFEPRPVLLRPGAIAVEEIEATIGPVERTAGATLRAPGGLPSHYAPRTMLRVIEPSSVALRERRRAGALGLRDAFDGYARSRVLSSNGDLTEAAANLFDALHELDGCGLERIDAQPVPEAGLGLAIMDRLRRAAAPKQTGAAKRSG